MAQNGTISRDLSSKQAKYVDALLVGSTSLIAAKTAGISPRTAARWKKEQAIQQELLRRRKEQFNETLEAFRAGLPAAMALVLDCIKDKETPRSIRLRAAEIWISHALEIHKMSELETQIAELQAILKARNG